MKQEKTFETKIKKVLESHQAWYVKYFANGFTKAGIPDILACYKGVFMGIEVKAENGKPSDLQIYHLKKIRKAGGLGIILYPKDFEMFKVMMAELYSGNVGKWNEYFKL